MSSLFHPAFLCLEGTRGADQYGLVEPTINPVARNLSVTIACFCLFLRRHESRADGLARILQMLSFAEGVMAGILPSAHRAANSPLRIRSMAKSR